MPTEPVRGGDWTGVAEQVRGGGPVPDACTELAVEALVASWDRDLATIRAEFTQRRAPVVVQAPPDLSVSQWLTMAGDPSAFALQLLRPVPRPSSGSAAAGEEFHDWAAARDGQLPLWDVDDLIASEDGATAAQQAGLREAFNASPFGALTAVAVEHEVGLPVAGRMVRGRIDAVFVIDGEHWVVDWKTGATGRADPLQLALYRAAWAAEHGIALAQVVGCFVFVAKHRYAVYRGLPDTDGLQAIVAGATVALAPTSESIWEV